MEWQPFCSDAQAIQMWSPYGFLDVKITEKKLYCLSLLLLLLWGFTEQLINISAIVLFVQSRATFYIPSYWPCQQSQAIQNQWFFFFEKWLTGVPVWWSPQSNRRWKRRKKDICDGQMYVVSWRTWEKNADILIKWNNIRLLHIYWVLVSA